MPHTLFDPFNRFYVLVHEADNHGFTAHEVSLVGIDLQSLGDRCKRLRMVFVSKQINLVQDLVAAITVVVEFDSACGGHLLSARTL